MIQGFFCIYSFLRVHLEHLFEKIHEIFRSIRNKCLKTYSWSRVKIKINSARLFSELIDKIRIWGAKYGENGWDLIKLIFTWEERVLGVELKENTANAPNIHFFGVVAISEENFRRSVPSSWDIFSIGRRRVCVYLTYVILLQEPKSANFSTLSPDTKMFSGFMSRWKISFSWM